MNWELVGIALYVVGMIGMGVYFSKQIKTDDDYYLGGRSLGPSLATFSIFATWFGAETCIGTAGAVYRHGLASIHADPIGYTVCLLVMGLFFAKVLWRKKITTIPDLFRMRFSPTAEKMAALLLIPSSVIWAGAQVRALGQIIQATTEFSPIAAVTVAACVVIIYTMYGGMMADAYADLIQGIAIIVGLLILVVTLMIELGGPVAALSSIPVEKLSMKGGDMAGLSFLGKLELWMVPILGSVMTQELVSRVAGSRSEKVAQNSALRAASIYFMVGSIPVLIGLMSVNYMPNLAEPETLMPVLAKAHLNPILYIVFVGALSSAILSTVDTTLMASSALLSHNLVYPLRKKEFTSRQKVVIARLSTLVAGILSYLIAYMSDSIIELVETASGLGGPSILVLTIIALWVKKGNAINAVLAMTMSFGTWLVGRFVNFEYPVILTVIVCAVTYFGTLPFTSKEEEKAEVELELS